MDDLQKPRMPVITYFLKDGKAVHTIRVIERHLKMACEQGEIKSYAKNSRSSIYTIINMDGTAFQVGSDTYIHKSPMCDNWSPLSISEFAKITRSQKVKG